MIQLGYVLILATVLAEGPAHAVTFEAMGATDALTCMMTACGDARLAPTSRNHPCSDFDGKLVLRRATCPGSKGLIVNPFALARLGAPGTDRCRNALYVLARRQADAAVERLAADPSFPADFNDIFTHARGVASFGCMNSGSEVDAVSGALSPVLGASEVNETDERLYCYNVVPRGCAAAGGSYESVDPPPGSEAAPQLRCRLGGVVLDDSCLDRADVDLRMLRASIEALRTTGVRCLRGDRMEAGANPVVGEELARHLDASTPRTQICCGAGCRLPVPWIPRPDTITGAGAVSLAAEMNLGEPGAWATAGTVLMTENSFVDATYQKAILFHEMLHQIGMCRSRDHNSYLGKTADDFDPRASYSGLCDTGYTVVWESGNPTCRRANECGGVLPPPPTGTIERILFAATWDPIYACQAACYYPSAVTAPRYASVANRDRISGNCGNPVIVEPANSTEMVGDQNLFTGCAE